jgi:hypothetical protein
MESVMSPGDPMCQLVVIDNRNREEAIVTCAANRSQKTFVAFFSIVRTRCYQLQGMR